MEDNTRKKLLGMIISLLVVLVGVGITFAFFSPSIDNQGEVTVDVTTNRNAKITYTTGQNIDFLAKQPGTSATALFNVNLNSPGGNLTGVYDIYWVITNNTFVHDQTPGETSTKEIKYSLYSSNDNTTWTAMLTDVDLTGVTGQIKLATNELILASSNTSITKYYKLEITYPSLPKDQSYNMEKQITGHLEIRPSM